MSFIEWGFRTPCEKLYKRHCYLCWNSQDQFMEEITTEKSDLENITPNNKQHNKTVEVDIFYVRNTLILNNLKLTFEKFL